MNCWKQNKSKIITPPKIITLSFFLLILLGALLLNHPLASNTGESIGFLDAFFTSTSAVCVTGLVVVNTLGHWSMFGKIVILLLIQCGALGLLTILAFGILVLRRRMPLKDRILIQASYNQNHIGGMAGFVKRIVIYTVALEAIGAIILTSVFYFDGGNTILEAFGKGIFHSISAFCNAGFDIIGEESLTPYRSNHIINIVISCLIIAGGLGFPVLHELYECIHNKKKVSFHKRIHHLTLHCKIALSVTCILILSGAMLFLLLEWANPQTLGGFSVFQKLQASFFQSITLRTAGFNTIDQGGLTEASQFVACIYMMIGGSSAGTAGGMKTVTVGVIFIAMISLLNGHESIEAFGRKLPLNLLQKALTVACTMLMVVVASTLILCFTEQNMAVDHTFLDLLFESSSAAGTVGISTGITSFLSPLGKITIIFCMFLGRLSPITVAFALSMKLHKNDGQATYIEENVIIG